MSEESSIKLQLDQTRFYR